jgi:hypothetical protein
MRDYGKIAGTFWTRGSGKQLRGDAEAQVLALYLMTAPQSSMTGLYHLALPTAAHETGLTMEGASKALRRLSEGDVAHYDDTDELVWLPRMAFYQIGSGLAANDKRVKGVAAAIRAFEGHRFYWEFVRQYGRAYHLGIEAPPEPLASPSEGPCKPLRSQAQEQAQAQEQEQDPTGVCSARGREDGPPRMKIRVHGPGGTLREVDPTAPLSLDTLSTGQGRIHGHWLALLQSVRKLVNPQPSPAGAVAAAAALAGRPEAEQDALIERFVRDDDRKLARAGWPLTWFPARLNGYLAVAAGIPASASGGAGYSNDVWKGRKGGEVKL